MEYLNNNAENYSGILVVAECHEDKLLDVTLELICKAKELNTSLKQRIFAVIVGKNIENATERLAFCNADAVYAIQTENTETDVECAEQISRLIAQLKPAIVLFGATGFGRSLAPRVAATVKTGLTADCTSLEIDSETKLLRQTRPAFGGNLMATIVCPKNRPQMATVRPGVMATGQDLTLLAENKSTVFCQKSVLQQYNTPKIIAEMLEKNSDKLSDYDIIVAVGKGIGAKKNIAYAKELCENIGGKLACTRPLVDLGWGEYQMQVGQTGQTVAPKIYIACGISGAIQHLAGMRGAEKIIAINSDSEAPIFGVAQYGIVGDCVEVLKELNAEFELAK